MPRIDPNVDEGTIAQWLVAPGQPVEAGQPVVEIITDKATFELETDVAATCRRLCAPARSVVPVGYVLALLSDPPDEPLPDVEEENRAVLEAYRDALLGGGDAAPGRPPITPDEGAGPGAARATPAARRLARRVGIDLEALCARCGRVVRVHDVQEELHRRGGPRP